MAFIGNTNTTQAFTPAVDYFSGNGSTTAFTLSRPVASVAQVQAVVNNVAQNPSSAFTVSGNTITFTSAPSSGTNNIYVYYTSPITQVIAPGQGTVGTTQLQNGLTVNFADGTAAAPSITNDGDTNTGVFYPAADTVGVSTGGSERVRVDSSGNVGIGTSSPSYKLDVRSTLAVLDGSSNIGFYANGSAYTQIWQTLQSTNDFIIQTTASKYISFGINSAEKVRIDTSGNLLVGQTSQSGSEAFGITRAANTATYIHMIKTSQVECTWGLKSSTDSNMYIGSGSPNVGTYGVYLTNTGNSWNAVSDERMKTIVEPISNAIQKIGVLRSVIGYYNHDENKIHRPFLIAQDVQSVLPEAVSIADQETGILGLSYTDTIPLLVAAIKEQQALITALTARIEALENK